MTVPVRAVPESLAKGMAEAAGGAGAKDTVKAALHLLSHVEDRGDRDAAFLLLAADGLLTSACAAATGSSDPGAALDDILSGVLEALG